VSDKGHTNFLFPYSGKGESSFSEEKEAKRLLFLRWHATKARL
jgi:hypothetical protein